MAETCKVLHLISADGNWEPFTNITALAAALREQGVTSVIAAPDHSRLWELAEAAGVETLDYSLARTINPFRWKELGDLVKNTDAHIVHAHDADAVSLLSRSRFFGGDTRVVVSRHDLASQPSGNEYGTSVSAVICPSEALATRYRELGADPEKLHVVHNGINVAVVDRAVEERDVIRAYFRQTYCPSKEKPRFIVNIAPLNANGRQQDVIEAMPDILAALPQAHLFLMGEGDAREELERQAGLHAVKDDVSFLEPDKAFHRLLAAADLYVAPGVDDISGYMLETAMLAGCGVVARDSGCYRELLDDGKYGLLFPDTEGQGLKDVLTDILKDRRRREKMGAAARGRAAQQFGAGEQAEKVAHIYRKIAD